MNLNELVIVSNGDDWEALYVNGKLTDEGHSIRIRDLAAHTPIGSIAERTLNSEGYDQLAYVGRFGDMDATSLDALAPYLEVTA